MYVAIGIGTLLLGGWVLNSPPPDNQADTTAPSGEVAAPLLPSPAPSNPRSPTMTPMQPGGQQPAAQAPARTSVMPLAPTEAAPPGTPGTPGLSAPTAPALGEGAGGGAGGAYGPGAGYMPMAPTYQRPPTPSTSAASSPYNAFTQQQSSLTAAWTPQRAFSNYQPPSSGVSPYMNLYRSGTNLGTIDNYTTLVRPALQQMNANQAFGNDIFGLQRSARLQNAALQQLNQPRTLQSVGTPQYYMNSGTPQPYMINGGNGGGNGRNYGGYYPSYGP